MDTDFFIILGVLGGLAILNVVLFFVLFARVNVIQKQSRVFFAGRNGADLESTILAQMKHIKRLDAETKELYDVCEKIHALANTGLYKVGYLRFNPFKDVGGNQSFAIALLDGKNSGIVISSLFTREGTRVYAKPVITGSASAQFPFTEEEQKAITSATAGKYREPQ